MIDKPVLSHFSPVVLLATAVFLGSALPAYGQNAGVSDTTATPVPGVPHDYLVGLNEIVSPANGSLSVRIKAPAPHERGVNWPSYVFMWDSANQYGLYPYWQDVTDGGGRNSSDLDNSPGLTPTLVLGGESSQFGYSSPQSAYKQVGENSFTQEWCDVSAGYVFTDPDGGNHGMGLMNASAGTSGLTWDCSFVAPNVNTNYTTGGDEQYKAYLNTTSFPPTATVFDLHGDLLANQLGAGTILQTSIKQATQPAGVEDTNGNYINTTGRNWPVTYLPNGFVSTFLVPGTTNAPGSTGSYVYTMGSTSYPSFSLPATSVGPLDLMTGGNYCQVTSIPYVAPQGSPNAVVQSIEQPDGQYYKFAYDSVYGLVNKIAYPAGATVTYTWGANNQEGVHYRNTHGNGAGGDCQFIYDWFAVATRVVSYDGVHPSEEQDFTYNTVWPAAGNENSFQWISKTTTVTTYDLVRDPSRHTSSQTIYTYSPALPPPSTDPSGQWGDQGYMPVENTIQYKDTNGNLLKTVTKVWYQASLLLGQCETIYSNGSAIGTSGTFYTYRPGGPGGINPLASMTNLPTDVKEFDYTSSLGPGAGCVLPTSTPIKETVTSYAYIGATPFGGVMLDRPSTVQVYGNGTLLSETDYGYDGGTTPASTTVPETSATPPDICVSSPIGHDETNYGCASTSPRGNTTKIVKNCFAGSTNCLTSLTQYHYDTTGQVVEVTDGCGAVTCSDMTPGAGHTTRIPTMTTTRPMTEPCRGIPMPT